MGLGRQITAAIIVLCGMSVLDVGSRASAAFKINVLTPPANAVGGSAAVNEFQATPTWPISDDAQPRLLSKYLVACANLGSGGAGVPTSNLSSSGQSSTSAIGAQGILPDQDHASSECVRTLLGRTGLSFLLMSIFEPPRIG